MSDNNMNHPGIIDYLNSKNIEYFPVNLQVSDGKKELLPYTETNKRPSMNDFKNLSKEEIKERHKYSYKFIAIDTRSVQQFDIDSDEADICFDKAKSKMPYFKSSSKLLPHYFFELEYRESFGKRFTTPFHPKIECLNGQWSYADRDTVIYNSHCSIEPFIIKPKSADSPTVPTAAQRDVTHSDVMLDALLQLISKGYFEEYDSWYRIGAALFNLRQLEHLFDKYSKQAKNYGGTSKLWRQFNRRALSKIGLGSLCYYARESNPGPFCLWREQYLKSILDTINEGPKAVIEAIVYDLKAVLIYSNKTWFNCGENNVWRVCNKPDIHFQNTIHKKLDMYICDLAETKPADYNDKIKGSVDIKSKIDKKSFNIQLIDYGVELLNIDDFYSKLDTNQGYIAFKNGLYDLKTGKFHAGFVPEDRVQYTLDYDIPKKDNKQIQQVKLLFKKICNDNEECLDFVLRVLGYSLTGLSSEVQKFFVFVGLTAANGKSSLLEAMECVFPQYVTKLNGKAFLTNNSVAHKSLSDMAGKRIIYTEELPEKGQLNSELLKDVADGKDLKNTALYRTDEKIKIMGKIFMTSNHTPTFEADNGMSRKYCQLQFESKFLPQTELDDKRDLNGGIIPPKHFLADPKWRETILSLRSGVVHLMLDYAHKYFADGLAFPKHILTESRETCEDNDFFNDIWHDLEIKDNCLLSKLEVDNWVREHRKPFKYFKDAFKKKGIEYDSQKRANGKKGFFVGVQLGTAVYVDDLEANL